MTDGPVPSAIDLIAAERQRQIEVEGWTAEHDDEHSSGQMGDAAACYAMADATAWSLDEMNMLPWPFEWRWLKPTPDDRIRELVKAGALIVAEIERLQRKGGAA